jgi:hypothetical protein
MAEVVALLGRDVAQARTAAHDVDDDARQFRARQIGNAFLHQAQPGAGRSGHHALARRGRAVHHVDGSRLALGLHERAANFGYRSAAYSAISLAG